MNYQATQSPLHQACQQGDFDQVKQLIKQSKKAINSLNNIFQTPLIIACKHGHLNIISLLIQAGAKLDYYYQRGENEKPLTLVPKNKIAALQDLCRKLINEKHITMETLHAGLTDPYTKRLHKAWQNFPDKIPSLKFSIVSKIKEFHDKKQITLPANYPSLLFKTKVLGSKQIYAEIESIIPSNKISQAWK